ncbi:hypothetical protein OAK38_08975, partial [Verrucomicrobia bacterium]|nr:hypothetical protein [Verrucomicrobiota bacterium]
LELCRGRELPLELNLLELCLVRELPLELCLGRELPLELGLERELPLELDLEMEQAQLELEMEATLEVPEVLRLLRAVQVVLPVVLLGRFGPIQEH